MGTYRMQDERAAAAEAAFESYDFGAARIEAAGGWERTDPGREWSRTIFLERTDDEAARDGTCDTLRAGFTVIFAEGSALVEECWANLDGEIIGRPGNPDDA